MFSKAISGMMFTLLLVGMFTFAFNVEQVKSDWTGTVYIRADGSIDPPDAPITTLDNVTYTLTDNITSSADGIVVERDNIILDGAGHTIEGTKAIGSKGIGLEGRSNVTVKSVDVKRFFIGSLLHYSSNVKLRNNTLAENKYNFGVEGWEFSHFIHDVDVSNLVDGKPIYYWINRAHETVPANAGYVALINCTNITVKNLNLTRNEPGILIANTQNSTITNNTITANYKYGVYLLYSLGNRIFGNHITKNYHGIRLCHSHDNLVYLNNITNNWVGLYLENSSANAVSRNNVRANSDDGILLQCSSNNTISGNEINANIDDGIFFRFSSNNSISRNYITASNVGIGLAGSSYNRFWHNNLIDNTQQVYDNAWDNPYFSPSINVWDDGYPSGGNYWSDYSGLDLFSGPYQNVTGSDGIGDTPYVIDENNIDHYPLMSPWSPKPPTPPHINATLDINPKALNLRSRGKWITAYIELPEGYNVQDINVSTIMLNDSIPVELHPTAIGDYDDDSIADLMVKFDRQAVIRYIFNNVNTAELFERRFTTVTLTITGYLNDGTQFQGNASIRIIMSMPRGIGRHIFIL